MDEFYIKTVYAPGLKHLEGNEVFIEFSKENYRNRFSRCFGFLLYETGNLYNNGIGSKCIFAKGRIKTPVEYGYSECGVGSKTFSFTVKGVIEKHVDGHYQGLSANEINEICPALCFRCRPTQGGLYPISKTQFNALSDELNTR